MQSGVCILGWEGVTIRRGFLEVRGMSQRRYGDPGGLLFKRYVIVYG